MRTNIVAAAVAFVFAGFAQAADGPLAVTEKAALQAAMFRHIDQQLVNGVFLRLNPKEGRAEPLAPTKAHPMIMRMGEHFILCSDFRGPDGKDVNIDFYVARTGTKYVVFHTEVDNRKPLEAMMSAGKVKPVE